MKLTLHRLLGLVFAIAFGTAVQCSGDRHCNPGDAACRPGTALFLYTSAGPCTMDRSAMVLCYEFTGSAQDSGPNAHHGTLFGSADFVAGVTDDPGTAYHVANGDATSYILIPDAAMSGLGDFTIAFWAKIDTTSAHLFYFVNASNTTAMTGEAFGVSYDNTTDVLQVNLDTTLGISSQSTTVPDDLRWHHFVYLRAGSEIRLYLDSTRIQTTTGITTNLTSTGPDGAVIGQEADTCCPAGTFDGGQNMAGSIDSLVLYNRAFSDAEVQKLYVLAR